MKDRNSKNKKILPVAEPDLSGNEAKYIVDAIKNDRVSSSGKYLDMFEVKLAKYCGRKYALAVSNCTCALHLSLLALGIREGDEVIVPTFTFAASVAAIVHAGATPVFIDSKPGDWNLDESKLEELKTHKTKALMVVDIYGVPANYLVIQKWCEKNNIYLVEDSAESLGGEFNGKKAGSFGNVSCFSFYGNKNITTGEGGMCLTDDKDLYEKMKVLKNHGMRQSGLYDHEVVGYNYRLTNIQAAVGCAQMEKLGKFLKKREKNERLYREILGKVSGINFQKLEKRSISAYWLTSLLLPKGINVENVRDILKKNSIDTRRVFKPVHMQPAYKRYLNKNKYPVSEEIFERGISLPSSPLLIKKDVEYICKVLIEAIN